MKRLVIALAFLSLSVPAFAQQSVVEKYRSKYGTPLTQAQTVEMLRSIAAEVHGGLLVKPDGSNCGGYSCDIICFSSTQLFDVLQDSEGRANPRWDATSNPRGYRCEMVAIPTPTPPAPPEPDDSSLTVLEQRLSELDRRVGALEVAVGKPGTITPDPVPAPSTAPDLGTLVEDVHQIRLALEAAMKRFGIK